MSKKSITKKKVSSRKNRNNDDHQSSASLSSAPGQGPSATTSSSSGSGSLLSSIFGSGAGDDDVSASAVSISNNATTSDAVAGTTATSSILGGGGSNNSNKRRTPTTDTLFGSKEKYQKVVHQQRQQIKRNLPKIDDKTKKNESTTATTTEDILRQRINRTKSTHDIVKSLEVAVLPSSESDDDSSSNGSSSSDNDDDEEIQRGQLRLFLGQSTSILKQQGVVILKNQNNRIFSKVIVQKLQHQTSDIEMKVCSKLDERNHNYRHNSDVDPSAAMVVDSKKSRNNNDDTDSYPSFKYHEVASRCFGRLDIRYGMDQQIFQSLATNAYLLGIVHDVLGVDAKHVYTGLIPSFPGSIDQPWHQDGPCLFPELAEQRQKQQKHNKRRRDKGESEQPILPPLPSYALTLFIPLARVTESLGPTEFVLGSHINGSTGPTSNDDDDDSDDENRWVGPLLDPGDVLIYEYRTCHRGTSNLSYLYEGGDNEERRNRKSKKKKKTKKVDSKTNTSSTSSASTRHMIYLLFARPWFREHLNFGTERLFPDEVQSVAEEREGCV